MKTQIKINRSFRVLSNTNNINRINAIEELLQDEGFEFEKDTFYSLARRSIVEPKALGSSLAHYFGFIYIQDRASMLPPLALKPEPHALVLDMCASPGSKTSMLSFMLKNKGAVIGNEPNPTRLLNLKRNLESMQCVNAISCNYSGEKIALEDESFDFILLDPPCSGWGTIDKNPQVKEIWTKEKAQNLVALQKQLLKEAERLLKTGGTLVYSTCTTNTDENEEQVAYAMNELDLKLEALEELAEFDMETSSFQGLWRLEPQVGTQGFFVAKFRKKTRFAEERIKETRALPFDFIHVPELEEQGQCAVFGKNVHFIPEKILNLAQNNTNFRFQGIRIGKYTGHEVQLNAKLRFSEKKSVEALRFDSKKDLEIIQGLLSGQSLNYEGKGSIVPFYYKDLYLGNLTKKGKRLLWVIK